LLFFFRSSFLFAFPLNIVAMIAKEYGIEIDLDSQEGKGTAITLRWPPGE
jgi:signal transduction histidine kinase